MTFDPQFQRTQDERNDQNRQIVYNITPGHEARIEAHCARVQEEYFDSGLYHKEMHPSELIDD